MKNQTFSPGLLCNLLFVLIGLTVAFNPLKAQWEPVKYEIDFNVDFDAQKLYAKSGVTIKNNSSVPLHEVDVFLYRLLTVTSANDLNGNGLTFEQEVITFEGIPKLQVNSIKIDLPEPVEQGESFYIELSYDGYIIGYTEGFQYVKEHIEEPFTILRWETFCYPIPGNPTINTLFNTILYSYDYKAKITVPEHLVVADIGELISKTFQDGNVTYTYKNIKPAWRMGFAISSYEILEDDGIRVFVFSENRQEAQHVMNLVKRTLNLYTEWFGPLKDFTNFSIIQVPEGYGSQADVTGIYQSAEIFSHDNISANIGIYHELSHLWHPMEIEPSPPCRWNEGLATFLQNLVAEKLDNRPGFLNRVSHVMKQEFVNQCKNRPDCMETPLIDYGKTLMFDYSYNKGMILFHVLYELIGHDSFMNLIGSYYNKYYQTGGSTHALTEMIKELPYKGVSRFVDEWFYGVESNEYLFQGMSVEEIVAIYKK